MARIVNRALAAVVALTILAGGLVVAVEIAAAAAGRPPVLLPHDRWYADGRTHAWSSASARWLFAGLAAAGLVLLLLQLAGRRPQALVLRDHDGGSTEVSRRSLERSLQRTTARVDGVASARAKVSPAKAHIEAASNRRLPKDLEPAVADVAAARLRATGLGGTAVAVDVKVRDR
ncbi:MAG TPA: DUF6286 domain-containing protein [Acidimicrobiales bacterium]|nr:DUF6286 domain-containing protein [Acidimicrobiales bacterium]